MALVAVGGTGRALEVFVSAIDDSLFPKFPFVGALRVPVLTPVIELILTRLALFSRGKILGLFVIEGAGRALKVFFTSFVSCFFVGFAASLDLASDAPEAVLEIELLLARLALFSRGVILGGLVMDGAGRALKVFVASMASCFLRFLSFF